MTRITPVAVCLLVSLLATTSSKLVADETGQHFAALGRALGQCLNREARIIAPKKVDLETASTAVLARCKREAETFRQFVYTDLPNFNPAPDWWDKEMEPGFLKRAREAVALARTQ
jgi:hypothetical protein